MIKHFLTFKQSLSDQFFGNLLTVKKYSRHFDKQFCHLLKIGPQSEHVGTASCLYIFASRTRAHVPFGTLFTSHAYVHAYESAYAFYAYCHEVLSSFSP